MSISISIGQEDFASLRESDCYYVDKTEFIYELVNKKNAVTLITRPRRFGKTLMMNVLKNFFSMQRDGKHIFEGLAITKHEEFCKEWMNQYPVIYISLKDVDGMNFDEAYDMLKSEIASMCIDIANIVDADVADKDDMNKFYKLKSESGSISDVRDSLKTVMRILHAVYGKKVILLIDEYDVPLAKASEGNTAENEYYSKMLKTLQEFMSSTLKDNEFLQFAVITGCLRIAKESIFTGINDLVDCSVLNKTHSQYFGFSEDEVEKMLELADRKEAAPRIKDWYDGYIFGNSRVYCPWDIINYVSTIKKYRTDRPKNYWRSTSHNGIILDFLRQHGFIVKDKFETLMNGGTIRCTITEKLTYDQLYSSEDNFWSVLLMTGYVTKADTNDNGNTVSLKIPNKEIFSLFEDTVVDYFEETVNTDRARELINTLLDCNESQATEILSEFLRMTISYNDYHENYYHAFLTRVFSRGGYSVRSNKRLEPDRPSIMINKLFEGKVIFIEEKKSDKESDMDKDADTAMKQVVTKEYAEDIENCKHIIFCGISFFQKQAKVKLMR